MTDGTAPVSRPASRSDLDIEIDRAWRIAVHASDPEVATKHWARHNELARQRAAQQQQGAGAP